jgi:hypothetical protein
MPAKATQEVRIVLNRLDSEVVNLPRMAGTRDESSQLGERDSSPVTTVPDRRCEGVAVYGVRTERDLGQRRWARSGRSAKARVVWRHRCIHALGYRRRR